MKHLVTLVVCMVLLHLTSGRNLLVRRKESNTQKDEYRNNKKYDVGQLRRKRGDIFKKILIEIVQQTHVVDVVNEIAILADNWNRGDQVMEEYCRDSTDIAFDTWQKLCDHSDLFEDLPRYQETSTSSVAIPTTTTSMTTTTTGKLVTTQPGAPSIIALYSTTVLKIHQGENVTLKCGARGFPTPLVTMEIVEKNNIIDVKTHEFVEGRVATVTAWGTIINVQDSATVLCSANNGFETKPISRTKITILEPRCILLIGGRNEDHSYYAPRVDIVEYYHPREGLECDVRAIGRMSTVNIPKARSSSCFMSDTKQILIREVYGRGSTPPPMVYSLADSSATRLPYQYRWTPKKAYDTVSAAVNGSSCISCGGRAGRRAFFRECYQFDSSSRQWTTMPSMPRESAGSASVLMGGNDFYVIGGANHQIHIQDQYWLFWYDVAAETWNHEKGMREKRRLHSAAPLSATEFIVCGGYDKKTSCEIYDTTTNKWCYGGNMTVGRHSFRMVNFNGQVYAMGGLGAGVRVEKYDPASDTWSFAKSLKHKRFGFESIVV